MRKLKMEHNKPNKPDFLIYIFILILTAYILSLILLIFEYKNYERKM